MKKKILICTLCFTIIFSSLNINKSYALPQTVSLPQTVVIAGVVSHLGSLAFKTLDVVLTGKDVIEVGNYVWSKFTPKQQEELIDSYNKDVSEFEDLSQDYIKTLPKQEYNYHFTPGIPKIFTIGTNQNNWLLDQSINIGNQTFKYNIYRFYDSSYSRYKYRLFYSNNLYDVLACAGDDSCSMTNTNILSMYYMYDSKGNFSVGCKYDGVFKHKAFIPYFNIDTSVYSCDNCPHEFDFPNTPESKFEGITEEQKDYIKENYPEYDVELLPPNYDSNGGNGGNGGNNNPIINNPPSFPNLQEFDFSGLQLEPLTNLFSNFKNKFPFSLPFDFANLIGGLVCDPIPPRFETEILNYNFVIDFTDFEVLAQIIRAFTLLSYVVSLIFITKKIGG